GAVPAWEDTTPSGASAPERPKRKSATTAAAAMPEKTSITGTPRSRDGFGGVANDAGVSVGRNGTGGRYVTGSLIVVVTAGDATTITPGGTPSTLSPVTMRSIPSTARPKPVCVSAWGTMASVLAAGVTSSAVASCSLVIERVAMRAMRSAVC